MRRFREFPKTARIRCNGQSELHILNHKVLYSYGIFMWMIGVVRSNNWDEMLTQFIRWEIKFDVVKDTILEELGDTEHMAFLILMKYDTELSIATLRKYFASTKGKKVSGKFKEWIKKCENWTELYKTLYSDEKFELEIIDRIKRECN